MNFSLPLSTMNWLTDVRRGGASDYEGDAECTYCWKCTGVQGDATCCQVASSRAGTRLKNGQKRRSFRTVRTPTSLAVHGRIAIRISVETISKKLKSAKYIFTCINDAELRTVSYPVINRFIINRALGRGLLQVLGLYHPSLKK